MSDTTREPTMYAITQPRYGSADVLRYERVPRPRLGEQEVRVRVRAASVCKGDVHILTGKPYLARLVLGLFRPKARVAGQDIAGVVEAVGARVTSLAEGDEVYGQAPSGGFAEFVAVPEGRLAKKPEGLDFAEAAALPDSAITALQGLRDAGRLRRGQRVLIHGASGGVGTCAVQVARALGAEITAVCSTRHVERVRSLGAHRVVDYTREDVVRSGERYDVIFDLATSRTLAEMRCLLAPSGVYVSTGGSAGGDGLLGPLAWYGRLALANLLTKQTLTAFLARPCQEDLREVARLVEAGELVPVIERTFSLSDAADAVRHVAQGHAQGKAVIVVSPAISEARDALHASPVLS